MSMKKGVLALVIFGLSLVLGMSSLSIVAGANNDLSQNETQASQDAVIHALYEKAIRQGKVVEKKYRYAAFKENYNLSKQDYETWKKALGKGLSYDEWFDKIVNYGAFPDGEGHSPSEPKLSLRGTQTQNGNKLKNAIQKGDILIISNGGFGHAAIATSDNYILEMYGGGNIWNWTTSGISNNNRQFSKNNWIFGEKEQGLTSRRYIDNWIQLWRIPNKSMANKCASYADATFWNSSHGYKKNKYINYRVTSATTTRDPNYCSKMIFQSFYYGSGSAEVVDSAMAGLTFISPGALPNVFTGKYTPYKVGTY
ncbi:hypothetical protein [Listeria sp. PSOL-1]|uniref:hypothetical protein n=1 Tax=Listeria sp. PSOL-1 TaxID=1844999 RepID=UPI001E35D293|nr:hypothetical protein [Listeria sp. PSOL-1]